MADHAHTTPPSRRRPPVDRASLSAVLGGGAAASSPSATNAPQATVADLAVLDFEPWSGVKQLLPDIAKRRELSQRHWDHISFALAIMEKTPAELAEIASKAPDAVLDLIKSFHAVEDQLKEDALLLEAASLRSMAGAARAGLS